MQEPSVSFKSKVFRSSLKQQGSRALFCLLPRSCSGISRQTRRSISRLVTWSAACHLSEKFFLSVISLNSSPSLNSTGNFLKDPCKPSKYILIWPKTKIEFLWQLLTSLDNQRIARWVKRFISSMNFTRRPGSCGNLRVMEVLQRRHQRLAKQATPPLLHSYQIQKMSWGTVAPKIQSCPFCRRCHLDKCPH